MFLKTFLLKVLILYRSTNLIEGFFFFFLGAIKSVRVYFQQFSSIFHALHKGKGAQVDKNNDESVVEIFALWVEINVSLKATNGWSFKRSQSFVLSNSVFGKHFPLLIIISFHNILFVAWDNVVTFCLVWDWLLIVYKIIPLFGLPM